MPFVVDFFIETFPHLVLIPMRNIYYLSVVIAIVITIASVVVHVMYKTFSLATNH